jgi:hypothetical protein
MGMEYEVDEEESISLGVVRAVSSVVGRDTCEIRPLAEVLDTDALDALFGPRRNGDRRPGGEVSFIYSGCRVTVQNSEYISVQPLDSCDSFGRSPAPSREKSSVSRSEEVPDERQDA